MASPARLRRNSRQGSSLIEFSLSIFTLMIVVLGAFEFDRMALVYTTISEAARIGARYAIVHGCDRTGSGANGPSGSGSFAQVSTVVKEYAATGALNVSNLVINVNYPDSSTKSSTCSTANNNKPGSRVQVIVTYPYDPFTVLPLSVNFTATSEGIITF